MRIIKEGTKPPKIHKYKEYIKECKNCGCVFVYTYEDSIMVGFVEDSHLELKCPQCENYMPYPLLFKRRYKEKK